MYGEARSALVWMLLWEEGVDVGDTVEGLGRSERSSFQHIYVNM